jgi:hypothetical protein
MSGSIKEVFMTSIETFQKTSLVLATHPQAAAVKEVALLPVKKNFTMAEPVAFLIDELARQYRNDKGHGIVVSAAVLLMLRSSPEEVEEMIGRVTAAGYDEHRASKLCATARQGSTVLASSQTAPVAGTNRPTTSAQGKLTERQRIAAKDFPKK